MVLREQYSGWTKQEVVSYIYQYARVPAYRHADYVFGADPGVPPKEGIPANPMESMSILRNAEGIRIIVAGGPGNVMGFFQAQWLSGSTVGSNNWVTKKVELPANWNKLVAKYKNLVPSYVRY